MSVAAAALGVAWLSYNVRHSLMDSIFEILVTLIDACIFWRFWSPIFGAMAIGISLHIFYERQVWP